MGSQVPDLVLGPRQPLTPASCSKLVEKRYDPLLRHELEGVRSARRMGSLGCHTGPSQSLNGRAADGPRAPHFARLKQSPRRKKPRCERLTTLHVRGERTRECVSVCTRAAAGRQTFSEIKRTINASVWREKICHTKRTIQLIRSVLKRQTHAPRSSSLHTQVPSQVFR